MNLVDFPFEPRTAPSADRPRIPAADWARWRLRRGPAPLLDVFAEGLRLGFNVAEVRRALDEVSIPIRPDPWSEVEIFLRGSALTRRCRDAD